jgi:hypothetical protein
MMVPVERTTYFAPGNGVAAPQGRKEQDMGFRV